MRCLVCLICVLIAFVGCVWAQEEANPPPPLTLQDAVDTALRNHPTIRMDQATVEAAQQRVRQQVAGYLPKGGYTYTYSRQRRPLSAAVGGVQVGGSRTFSQVFDFNSTNFSMTQLLFDFGRNLNAVQAAVASADASTADLEATKQDVIFNTKQAYYGLLSSQLLVQVAEETVRQNQKHLEEARARFDVGVAPRFDVTQAQVQVSEAELNLVTARNNVELGVETLRTAMGQTAPLRVTLTDDLAPSPTTLDEPTILKRAYARRPELAGLQAQQRAAAERITALRKQFLPSLSGSAQYNWTGREYPLQQGWNLGVAVTVPLFDSILTTSQLGEAQATLRNLEAQEQNLRQQVTLEVRQSLLNARRAAESIRVTGHTLGQAQENLELAEGRYAAGVGNILEVTDAQVSLTRARASNIKALYDHKTALAELEKAVGAPLD